MEGSLSAVALETPEAKGPPGKRLELGGSRASLLSCCVFFGEVTPPLSVPLFLLKNKANHSSDVRGLLGEFNGSLLVNYLALRGAP